MIDVKEAVQNAINHLYALPIVEKPENLALEEVELSEDDRCWHITLGYEVQSKAQPAVSGLGIRALADLSRYIRKYKIFRVSAETGEVLSMKIREL